MDGIWMIMVLLLAAMILMLMEIITPSFGLLGLMALLSLAAAGYVGFTSYGPWAGGALVAGIVLLTPAYLLFLVRKLPKWGVGKGLFLGQADADRGQSTPAWLAGLVGKTGQTLTPLRPIGTIMIEGRRYQASADGGFIPQQTRIKVVRFDGMEIVVRAEQ